MEKTFILIKPDALRRQLLPAILGRLQDAGLLIDEIKSVRATAVKLENHFSGLKKYKHSDDIGYRTAYDRNVKSLLGKTVVIATLRGQNAIQRVRKTVGDTMPFKAEAGTIRGYYGTDTLEEATAENRALENLIHAADSSEAVRKEIKIWF